MKQINDKKIVHSYLEKYNIFQYFDTDDLTFSIYKYRKGEFLRQPLDANDIFHFVISGEVNIYYIREDGSKYCLAQTKSFFILGDMELLGNANSLAFAETMSEVTSIGISLSHYRDKLMNDKKFLHLIIRTLSQRLFSITDVDAAPSSLQEKVLNYMQYHCKDGILSGVEKTSFKLHCSDRQLQRILNELMEKNLVMKCKKGTYQLLS